MNGFELYLRARKHYQIRFYVRYNLPNTAVERGSRRDELNNIC